MVRDPVTQTMVDWQPHLGAGEVLEPLGSDLHRGLTDGSNDLYSSPGQLWLGHDPVTPTMATWHPHLGTRDGLEPLRSASEECRGQVKWFDIN